MDFTCTTFLEKVKMIISVKLLKSGRKCRYCDTCHKEIKLDQPRYAMFGAAERSDPKYSLYTHVQCIGERALVVYLKSEEKNTK